MNFEIVPKDEDHESADSNQNIIKLLKKIGLEAATIYFDNATQLINALEVKQNDPRLTYTTSLGLSITIGQRYCFAFITNHPRPWQFINSSQIPSTDDISVGNFSGKPQAYYYRCKNPIDMENRINEITNASEIELNRTNISRHRRSNKTQFEMAIFDRTFRNQLFEKAFDLVVYLTGNVWKLGCNWGSKNPNFYEMIKARSIVIGVNDKLYSPGDLIVITEGHAARALGKVLELPNPVTGVPELKKDFDKYKIDFDVNVNFAKVEWYDLQDDEIFMYQLQQGICKVNVPYVRNRAIEIWNDRFINYWIFQCNPSEFNFETAVRKNLLHDWTVAAHKEKIKIDDKVILWLTGKRAGCYALAKVTSNPAELTDSLDNHLWKTEPRISTKSNIELLNNLLDKPLLWQNIKDNEDLKDLKVGNQGTNFTATRKQYNTLLKLIEKSPKNMSNKIPLFVNTILYGPPGTGKTFNLNKYKEEYFTDRDVTKSVEEVLKEKIPLYPFWKILAAVLNKYDVPVSVSELLSNPLVKAKINPDAKTPRNTVWRILQSYANDASTEMEAKYKGPLQLFQKNGESQWSIIPEKKQELVDIVDQELFDFATEPDISPVRSMSINNRFKFITFHQKYSYEDFIEGIKPLLKNDEDVEASGELQFELKKGIFYNSCLEALRLLGYESFLECYNDTKENRESRFNENKEDATKQYALFIDEINRANISAVLGELITLLEDDKRMGANNEMWVELPYSNEKFCVPPNLYVIGTMNTADRSIALLDIALRRRFEFKALYPDYPELTWWAPLLESLNQAIYNWKKNPDFFIGHAFFMNKVEMEKNKILNTKIIPLLYEYCQNNAETIKRILSEAGIQIKVTSIKESFQIIAE